MTKEDVSKLKYEDALKKLKEISDKLEKKEVPIDDLTEQVKIANMLSDHCNRKLSATEKEIRKIIDSSDIEIPEDTDTGDTKNHS